MGYEHNKGFKKKQVPFVVCYTISIMHRFVIDTNFFINLQRPLNWGETKEEVVANFAAAAEKLVPRGSVEFFTTPSSLQELEGFFEEAGEHVKLLRASVSVSSANMTTLQFDATLFHQLVEETAKRLYRGLRAAEEPFKEVILRPPSPTQENQQLLIGQLRNKYRRATREGFLDSTIDLELILLARERDAHLVTSDQGVIEWGRRFGCREMQPEDFVKQILNLIKSADSL